MGLSPLLSFFFFRSPPPPPPSCSLLLFRQAGFRVLQSARPLVGLVWDRKGSKAKLFWCLARRCGIAPGRFPSVLRPLAIPALFCVALLLLLLLIFSFFPFVCCVCVCMCACVLFCVCVFLLSVCVCRLCCVLFVVVVVVFLVSFFVFGFSCVCRRSLRFFHTYIRLPSYARGNQPDTTLTPFGVPPLRFGAWAA